MARLAGAMCGVRNDSSSRKHKYARTSQGMASESLSRGVDLFFAQKVWLIKQEHGPPRGSKQAKTEMLLTTVQGPLRSERTKVNVRQRALAFVSIMVSWLAFCPDFRSDACGPSMGVGARRLSQLFTVDDRP